MHHDLIASNLEEMFSPFSRNLGINNQKVNLRSYLLSISIPNLYGN